MKQIRFMRIILFFDLPQVTSSEKRSYRNFHKLLISEGFIMVQFSIYSKLCLNHDVATKVKKRLERITPKVGDIRYMIVSETQYNSIRNLNNTYSKQENITNMNRLLIFEEENDQTYK